MQPVLNGETNDNYCQPDRILNKRSELISKCRHEKEFYLRNNWLKNNTLLAFFSHLVFSHLIVIRTAVFINNKRVYIYNLIGLFFIKYCLTSA